MSKNQYSISELSTKINVTKQCVYNKLNLLEKKLKPHLTKVNGVKYISKEGAIIIYQNLKPEADLNIFNDVENNLNFNETIENNLKDQLSDMRKYMDEIKLSYENQINILKDEVDYLKNESTEKNSQLNTKNELLKNMQVLLKDQKLMLESKEKKHWWQFWKN